MILSRLKEKADDRQFKKCRQCVYDVGFYGETILLGECILEKTFTEKIKCNETKQKPSVTRVIYGGKNEHLQGNENDFEKW